MAIRDPQHEHMSSGMGAIGFALSIVAIMGFGALAIVTTRMGAASIPIWGIVGGGVVLVFRGPVGQALAARISGGARGAGEPTEVAPELYAELDELRARVGELEERVDFSERLLTQGKNETKVNNAN